MKEGGIYTVLSPMAGVTDMSFRTICTEMGADLTVTEMVSAKAVTYHNKNTFSLCRISDTGHPASLQLFGSDPQIMAEAAGILAEKIPFEMLDINMGCPMPKIVNNGEGSALMKDPLLVGRIVEAVAKAIDKPVTVKLRAGFDAEHINAPEIAYIAQESGAEAVTVHGRTREQYYEGQADWGVIAAVRERVRIRVIGNGDVTGLKSAEDMIGRTGCDGVAIGRAAQGNPWIFKEIAEGHEYIPSVRERKEMMLRHLKMTVDEKGEYTGIREMRRHISRYTAGMPGSARLRDKVNNARSLEELNGLICDIPEDE
ncbi:MAG: tRNA dihydrouridine synthase DusB [Lachnospiraceae bacterium]|nr:tRNA dihydrouridine synthase DusB [Lachnospiraceae bacterium]